MKQSLFFLCLNILGTYTCAAAPFYTNAIVHASNRSVINKNRRTNLLTDEQYRKEKKIARQKRHEEKAAQRKTNQQEKSQKLQSMHNYITANRTSADHQQKTRALHREKTRMSKKREVIEQQKSSYTKQQEQKIKQKINAHKAAREALLKK